MASAFYVNNDPTPNPIGVQGMVVESGCDPKNPGHVDVADPYRNTDFIDVCGHVFIVSLPAGQYYIAKWDANSGSLMYGPRAWKPVPFTVQAGRATYVGNIHFGVLLGPDTFLGKHSLIALGPVLDDQSARDIRMLQQRYPWLVSGLIDKQLLELPPVGEVGASSMLALPPPVVKH